jgi:putative ABC transport system permease protein
VPMTMIGKPATPYTALGNGTKEMHTARRYGVGKEFFTTMGIPIVRGRGFRKDDEADHSRVAIVSEKFVRDSWPGEDGLGRRIEIGEDDLATFELVGARAPRRRGLGRSRVVDVIGVAKDVQDGLVLSRTDGPALIYVPLRPADLARPPSRGITLLVRGAPGADAATAVRREIAAIDNRLTIFDVGTLVDHIGEITSAVRSALWTYGCIGLFGLILASVGLAGVTAYSVVQRRREIGIRIAVGARRGDVLRLVMKQGLVLVTVGSAIGFLLARAGIRGLSAMMSEIARTAGNSTSDPLLLIGAPLLLAVVALAACYLPARGSTRIDPVEALRTE